MFEYIVLGAVALIVLLVMLATGGFLFLRWLLGRGKAVEPTATIAAPLIEYRQPSAVESAKAVQNHINNLALEHFLASAGKSEAVKIGQQFAGWANGPADAPKS